jgi:predicted ATP-dependent protease
MSSQSEVPAEKLRWVCDIEQFKFQRTSELTPLAEFIGQDRAIRAMEFGLAIDQPGYNIYVAGLAGTGRTSAVKTYIQKVIEAKKTEDYQPEDWCYLHNFTDPDRPQIVNLPQGKGRELASHLDNLLESLQSGIKKAFSNPEYEAQRKQVVEKGQEHQQQLFKEVEEEAVKQSFRFQVSPAGLVLIPMANGKPLSEKDYAALSEKKRRAIENKRSGLKKLVEEVIEKARNLEKDAGDSLKKLDHQVAEFAIAKLFDDLLTRYDAFPKLVQYLKDLKNYTLEHLELFRQAEVPQGSIPGMPVLPQMLMGDPFLPYRVNIFVDNSQTKGPPIVIESNPIYGNMFGKTERRFFLGGYLSNHTMLKPGALSLANGGYLLLNARDVLLSPGVWETLKRVIKNKEVHIEDPFEQFGLIAPQGLRPQPMPVKVKIVLIGEDSLYHLLSAYDEDFWEIFKVKADFDFQIERTAENTEAYACFIAGCCEGNGLKHFDRSGVAKVVEYGARLVADQLKLSSRFAQIKDIILEADYWAKKDGSELVSANHVQQTLEEKVYRHNLIDEHIRELIRRGTLMIDAEGSVVGQVNGLSVYSLGDAVFGRPSRITARTYMGRSGVINIERESQLSGRIHDKGVLILNGYLGWKYAQQRPLSLSASLCFEQSYEGVEGDSASSTELYALLSSLSGVPIKQNIAVTGSVNQKGEIQPIGGVNHKIEGFFRVCRAKGLNGEQGVLIPAGNLENLMLHEEVVEAVRQGKFHVYAAKSIDEGIEILTGTPAGERQADGSYPEGTINYLVDKRLRDIAEGLKKFAEPKETEKKEA